MARHNFTVDRPYAGKLVRIAERPLENDPGVAIRLLRLEFAIYWMFPDSQQLESQGEFACRELLVGSELSIARDAGLNAYANVLRVESPITQPASWAKLAAVGRWIEIHFGPPEHEWARNPFHQIRAFDPAGWSIKEFRYDASVEWVSPGHAAEVLSTSESTVRRQVDALEPEWGTRLVVRTVGNHRRIYLPLFVKIRDD